jgi:hypothetical protein
MVQLLRFSFLACAALVIAAVMPAIADEYVSNPGPVGPNEPILLTVGGQRIIAFFVPERGSCAVNTITWKDEGADAPHASRVRLSLRPGQMARFDDAHMTMNLLCGVDASTLAVVAPPELLTRAAAND